MDTALLFSPYAIKSLTLKNRIVMPPMCQYAATDSGVVNSYHMAHYSARALGGVGLVIVEATAVASEGRISFSDLGIWTEEQVSGLTLLAKAISDNGAVPAIQLAHAGRKAAKGIARRVAPSPVAFSSDFGVPQELPRAEIRELVGAFADASQRAAHCGFKVLEIHAAHGYLLHEFLSPLSNQRTDEYGGGLENRMRFLLEVVTACKAAIPSDVVLSVRLSGCEYSPLGYTLDDIVCVATQLHASGIEMIHMSSGGNLPLQPSVWPGYQLALAQAIRKAVPLPVIGVGLLKSPEIAEFALREGYCDLVAVGRALLHDPNWAVKAAIVLGANLPVPQNMARGLQR